MFLEFDIPEEAKWVLEAGRKSFNWDLLQLEWWRPDVGCTRNKGVLKEAWIRVVGLPLHPWQLEILKNIGNTCGGFLALDKETALRVKVTRARMLVKVGEKTRPSVVNILEGSRSFELQIWWEIPPWLTDVYPEYGNSRETKRPEKPKVEDDAVSCVPKRVGLLHPRLNNEK